MSSEYAAFLYPAVKILQRDLVDNRAHLLFHGDVDPLLKLLFQCVEWVA